VVWHETVSDYFHILADQIFIHSTQEEEIIFPLEKYFFLVHAAIENVIVIPWLEFKLPARHNSSLLLLIPIPPESLRLRGNRMLMKLL
jgi:hypothetical protein